MKIKSKRLLKGDTECINTVTRAKEREVDVLFEAQRCWDSLSKFRKERIRNKKYTFGDQWSDVIKDENGKSVIESEYMSDRGNAPLKNNLIRRLVKTVLGQFRSNQTEPVCIARDRDEQRLGEMMSTAMQYNYQLNKMNELDGRSMEEFLISGLVAHKDSFDWRKDKMEVWTDAVNPNRLFFDTKMEDIRHWDMSIIGEVHDISLMDLIGKFAENREDGKRLSDLYRTLSGSGLTYYMEGLTGKTLQDISFLTPSDPSLCRVIEVWKKESKERIRCHDVLNGEYYKDERESVPVIEAENRRRVAEAYQYGIAQEDVPLIEWEWFVDSYWYYRFLTPTGEVLKAGESPYTHKEHPYTLKIYPFIDGEVHSFVSDVIDQQRYINRLVTLIDFIMRSSAKGVLMYPEDVIPEDMTREGVMDEWVRYNGVIFYKPKPGVPMPQQIASNSTNVGAHELLNLQMKLMEEASGVHAAIQGKSAPSGTAASLYRQQSDNAATTLVDLMESFKNFREERDTKKMKMIQQFYTEKRMINIVGDSSRGVMVYDPEKVSNVEFDLSITESTASPAYRLMGNEFLMQLFQMGQIDVEMLLENGAFPFSDQLLQAIQSRKEEMVNQQNIDG